MAEADWDGPSLLSLAWKDKKSGVLSFVRFDVITTETHESIMAITEHPVEEGTDVVDNARPKPKKLSIEGFISNKPIWSNPGVFKIAKYSMHTLDLTSARKGARPKKVKLELEKPPIALNMASLVTAGIGALLGAIFGDETYATLAPDNRPGASTVQALLLAAKGDFADRAVAMHKILLDAQKDRALVTVTTKMGVIENMLIEKVGLPRTVETGNGADFQIELTQIRIVKSETADAPEPAEKRGAKPKSVGSNAAVLVEEPPEKKKKVVSVLEAAKRKATGDTSE